MKHYSEITGRYPRTLKQAFGPYAELYTPKRMNKADIIYTVLTVALAIAIGVILALGV